MHGEFHSDKDYDLWGYTYIPADKPEKVTEKKPMGKVERMMREKAAKQKWEEKLEMVELSPSPILYRYNR